MKQTGGIGSAAEATMGPMLQFTLDPDTFTLETIIQRHTTNSRHAVEIIPRLIRSDCVGRNETYTKHSTTDIFRRLTYYLGTSHSNCIYRNAFHNTSYNK